MTYLSSHKECPSCGDNHKGNPYCLYENGAHCFSCGYTKSYDRSFSIQESRKVSIPELPNLKSRMEEFTLENQLWLNKYYITKDHVGQYHISEAPDGALVFCNIDNNGDVTHYQMRYNTIPRRILSKGPKTPSISSIEASTIVLVEDYLSHIRVGELFDTACLWGTKASYDFLKSLLPYTTILVWLDNDSQKEINSGQIAAKKICKMLESILRLERRRFGFGGRQLPTIINIATDNDPKVYSPSEIKNILGACDAIPQ